MSYQAHPNEAIAEKAHYRIGAVSRLTNIPAETLRVWERRYQVVEPERTPGGNRVYLQHDVARLEIIKILVDNGHAISTVANLSYEALQERLKELQMAGYHMLKVDAVKQNIVIIGLTLPQQLSRRDGGKYNIRPESLEIMGIYNRLEDYLKERNSSQAAIDTLILELPTINDDSLDIVNQVEAHRLIIVYAFGPPEILRALENHGCILLRAPVSWRVLAPICQSGMTITPQSLVHGESQDIILDDLPPKKRFTDRQLAHYLAISSTIRCECPRHVAELIVHLNRFEKYSIECENRNEEDALLHSYLHTMTARSRSIMENALVRLSEIEKIPFIDQD